MNPNEQLLVEAVESYLNSKTKLGLNQDDKATNDNNPQLRGFEFLHGQIDEMFAHRAAELTHHTGVCAAFSKVHSYKYLDDNSFTEAMDKEMISQGVPAAERRQALEFIPQIIKELADEKAAWAERDFGFNQNLDAIMEIPDQHHD